MRNVIGVLLTGNRVLVLAHLEPRVTARLESIRVFRANGEAIPASFTASLKHFGALVVTLDKPLAGVVKASESGCSGSMVSDCVPLVSTPSEAVSVTLLATLPLKKKSTEVCPADTTTEVVEDVVQPAPVWNVTFEGELARLIVLLVPIDTGLP